MADPVEETEKTIQQRPHEHSSSCHRPLSRASRQLFRQDASHILLHYFGGRDQDAPWRRHNVAASSNLSLDPAVDKRGRKRERISLVDHPDDGLTDDEWYALLGYAIDQSIASASAPDGQNQAKPICPLHPKHDMFLSHDQKSFILQRRYRTGVQKFGAFTLPLTGRAARAAFWLEEREALTVRATQSRRTSGNSVFLFQCGICGKSFVSRYYLDKHMEAHHPHTHTDGTEIDSPDNNLICPADHVCEALGGISECVETMNAISPYYGRGTLLGKEYVDSNNDSFLSTSIHSLMSHFNPDADDLTETADVIQLPSRNKKKVDWRQGQKEGDVAKVTGEMRHRAARRNKLIRQALLHRQLNKEQGENWIEEESYFSDLEALSTGEGSLENDHPPTAPFTLCDNGEMERLFHLCQEMMHTCFGDGAVNDEEHSSDTNNGYTPKIANELINHICEPLHCQHRLHRMAGHNSRHAAHWNDQWDEHHSFSLGYFGWLVVLGVVIFYGFAFALGLGDDGTLPRQGQKKSKSM